MAELAFPGHFMVRLEQRSEPFHGGRVRDAAELRDLLKAIGSTAAELEPRRYAAVSDRDGPLRLRNSLKLRLVESQQPGPALAVIEGMLLFAPEHAGLWRAAGLTHAELGNLRPGLAALERSRALAADESGRQASALLQRLRARLQ